MRKRYILILLLAVFLLTACGPVGVPEGTAPATQPTVALTTEEQTTETTAPSETTAPIETTVPTEATAPEHSALYIPDVPVEDVIRYFNEVCLDSEFVNSGDPSVIQKWPVPIYYTLDGEYTDTDLETLHAFEAWLNSVEGFPGIYCTEDPMQCNLRIYFCDQEYMLTLLGDNFQGMDGGVTFWYNEDKIYDAIICYRTDIDQQVRNSVILEEIYNGIGPVQDTALREDSLIYTGYTFPKWMTPMDELILRLLYHPDIQPGMDAQDCEQVIRRLYY